MTVAWSLDTHHNDTSENTTQYNDTHHNDTRHNALGKCHNILQNDTWHDDFLLNNIHHKVSLSPVSLC